LYNYQAVRIWPCARANTDSTIEVLTRLRQQFPDPVIVLVWDGASYHRSAAVLAKAAELNIRLVRLPAYSPDFMPVEALWRWLRQEVSSLRCHSTVPDLIASVAQFVWSINMDPAALVTRLTLKSHLDPAEEILRFSNGF
jgi:transposase